MQSQTPKAPPPVAFPWDEVKAIDKRHVDQLLAINTEFRSFFRKHPFFETDPACRLARQLCMAALGTEEADAVDRLVTNSGHEPDYPMAPVYCIGPRSPLEQKPDIYPDFLIAANRPRPIWFAWLRIARTVIDRQNREASNA